MEIHEKIKMLKKKGWLFPDEKHAREILREVSPFHLQNYALEFSDPIDFEKVYRLFNTDRKLKLVLMEYLAHIEVRFRNVMGTVLEESYGAYGYLEAKNFRKESYHKAFMEDVHREIRRANEPYVPLYQKKGKFPVWVIVEMLSFGDLSKCFSNFYRRDQKKVASLYHVKSEQILRNYFHTFTILRNTCAHHGRIYNRAFSVASAIHHSDLKRMEEKGYTFNPYMFFGMAVSLCHVIEGERQKAFLDALKSLLAENPEYSLERINFPSGWLAVLEQI